MASVFRALRPDTALFRRAFYAGVLHGPVAWVRWSPPLFGLAFGAVLSRERRVVRDTLRRALGVRRWHLEARDVAAVFANFAWSMTDALAIGSGRNFALRRSARGEENFRAALASGRGLIAATAHTAGWDLAGKLLRDAQPAEVVVVMAPEPDPQARALHDEVRARTGVRVLHVGDDPLASIELLRHLQRGGVVALQIDRLAPGMRARSVELLGRPFRMPEGPLQLARLTGAAILPVFTRRLGFMAYEVIMEPPIELGRRAGEAEIDGAARRLAQALERFVRAYPTQWFRFREGD